MTADVAAYAPGLALDGMLVEKMGARGLELIVGARNDPEWGPVILAGFGGVQAEILQDVRLLTPDLAEGRSRSPNSASSRARRCSHGFRGSPALDVGAVADIVRRHRPPAARRAADPRDRPQPGDRLSEGQGAVALDALMLAAD